MPPPRMSTPTVLLDLLDNGPATRPRILERTGLSWQSVMRAIRELHESLEPRVHIESWQTSVTAKNPKAKRAQRRYAPVFAYGAGLDALKPAPLTRAERNARYKARPAARKVINAAERKRHWRDRAPRRDKMIAALFGQPPKP